MSESGATGALLKLRADARAVLVWTSVLTLVAAALGAALALGVIDFVLRLPGSLRGMLLVLGVGALAWGVRRAVIPALRFAPPLAELALRVERAAPERALLGWLASGVELRADEPGLPGALAGAVRAEAEARARGLDTRSLVRRRELDRSLVALAAIAIALGAVAAWRPTLAATGAARVLAPWSGAEWPKRTAIVDGTGIDAAPIDEAIPLRAILTATDRAPGQTGIAVRYRVLAEGLPVRTQRSLLTGQRRTVAAGEASGELYERLIDVSVDREARLEYWFETEDDRTPTRTIQLAERPRVTDVIARIEPPEYAAGADVLAGSVPIALDTPGVPARLGPILAGSRVELRLSLSKPATWAGEHPPGWDVREGGSAITLSRVASEPELVEAQLRDGLGLSSGETLGLSIEVTPDAQANASVIEPARDESALATAVLDATGEARDDIALEWISLEAQHARPPGSSEGAAPEALGEPREFARVEPGAPTGEARARLDFSVMGLRAGDELWLTALAEDLHAPGEERVSRSPIRRVRIITESDFVEQVRSELAGVRRAAIALDQEQGSLQEQLSSMGPSEDGRKRQEAVTQRLEGQTRAIEQVGERVARNGLTDQSLRGMLDDAAGLLEDAGESSDRAASSPDTPEGQTRAAEAQQDVRDNLETLVAMLDRGEDGWLAQRSVENLLREQTELMDETRSLGERTRGRDASELTPDERTELERIAARQRRAAEQARQAIESLADRADELRRTDPGRAQSLSGAAARGRQSGVSDAMNEAADRLQENQTGEAGQSQDEAARALEEMLRDLASTDRNRDEALRRTLESVIQSLDTLIVMQERELARLDGQETPPELVPGMVRLVQQTLAVLDIVRAQQELGAVASLVDDAALAQERAAGALQRSDSPGARTSEAESLEALRAARAEAQRIDSEASARQNARKRAELRQKYRELLEQQSSLAGDTRAFVGVELDRRRRAEVRGLGERQAMLRQAIADIEKDTTELSETEVFALAHARLDRETGAASDSLRAGIADTSVARRQATSVRILQSLVEAMAEQEEEKNTFREGESQSGGGGSGGQEPPVIPDLAELKLLRAMQAEAFEWTRSLEDAGTPAPTEELSELAELQEELAARGQALIDKLSQRAQEPAQSPDPTPPNPGQEEMP